MVGGSGHPRGRLYQMLGGGGGGSVGAGLGRDPSAVIQAAVVGLVLFSAAVVAVRRAAPRRGTSSSKPPGSPPPMTITTTIHPPTRCRLRGINSSWLRGRPPAGKRRRAPSAAASAPRSVPGASACGTDCHSKHWLSDHRFKCKQMKKLDPGDKLPYGGEGNSKRSSGFGRISLVPAQGKLNKVIFPYDEFLKLYNWKDLDFLPCGLVNCGNSCFTNVVLQCLSCTRPLVAYLLGPRRHEDWCFLCELQCHIQRASESLHSFAPMNILSHLPNIGGSLGFGRQEDAHEFMRFAVDKMQSACLDEFGGEKAVVLITQETTLIQHIFGGCLQSQVQCTACGMVSNRYANSR